MGKTGRDRTAMGRRGKGKVVDLLTGQVQAVVRFQGLMPDTRWSSAEKRSVADPPNSAPCNV